MSDTKTESGNELPRLTPQEIVERLQALLQRLGDFSAYVADVNAQGGVTINTFTHRPACVTLPMATLAKTAVSERRLDKATRTVELLSKAIEEDADVPYEQVRAACVVPPNWLVDAARTAAIDQEPPSDVEPGDDPLPRLTPEAIKAFAASLLQDYGDLSAYVSAKDSGRVVLRVFSPKSSFVLPAATQPGEAVGKDRLGSVTNAVRKLNSSFIEGATEFEYDELDE